MQRGPLSLRKTIQACLQGADEDVTRRGLHRAIQDHAEAPSLRRHEDEQSIVCGRVSVELPERDDPGLLGRP